MDYDQVASKERLTGRAYFNAGLANTYDCPWLDLGNIQMMSLDYGIKRKEHYKARRGALIADRFDAYSATPRWTITGDEFTSATLFLIFLGDGLDANTTQAAAVGATVTFNGHKGGVYDTGKFAVYNWSIGGGMVSGVDYIMDAGPGKIYIPLTSTWVEGAPHQLTYSCPALTWNMVLPPMSNLNRTGQMQVIEEDDSPAVSPAAVAAPKTIHDFPVSLSTDSGGDTRVDNYKEYKMVATITDPTAWSIKKRNT